MGKVLLHARVTPATGGCSGTRVLACTAEGSLYVRTDNTIAAASASISENMAYLAGHAVDHNAGAVGDGTQRVVLANNTYALVSATNAANATANRIYVNNNLDQLAGSAVAVGEGALAATGLQRITIATDDDVVTACKAVQTATEIIDNVIGTVGAAAPTAAALVGVSDGTSLRALSGDSAGVLYNQPKVVPSFEDSVNAWAKVRQTSHASAALADPAAVAISGTTEGAANEILASTNISTYRGVTVWVKNVGGGSAAALSHVYVYVSRNGTDWTLVDAIKNAVELLCDSLAATKIGIAFTITTNPGWQYIKATATVAATDTTAFGSVSYQM